MRARPRAVFCCRPTPVPLRALAFPPSPYPRRRSQTRYRDPFAFPADGGLPYHCVTGSEPGCGGRTDCDPGKDNTCPGLDDQEMPVRYSLSTGGDAGGEMFKKRWAGVLYCVNKYTEAETFLRLCEMEGDCDDNGFSRQTNPDDDGVPTGGITPPGTAVYMEVTGINGASGACRDADDGVGTSTAHADPTIDLAGCEAACVADILCLAFEFQPSRGSPCSLFTTKMTSVLVDPDVTDMKCFAWTSGFKGRSHGPPGGGYDATQGVQYVHHMPTDDGGADAPMGRRLARDDGEASSLAEDAAIAARDKAAEAAAAEAAAAAAASAAAASAAAAVPTAAVEEAAASEEA